MAGAALNSGQFHPKMAAGGTVASGFAALLTNSRPAGAAAAMTPGGKILPDALPDFAVLPDAASLPAQPDIDRGAMLAASVLHFIGEGAQPVPALVIAAPLGSTAQPVAMQTAAAALPAPPPTPLAGPALPALPISPAALVTPVLAAEDQALLTKAFVQTSAALPINPAATPFDVRHAVAPRGSRVAAPVADIATSATGTTPTGTTPTGTTPTGTITTGTITTGTTPAAAPSQPAMATAAAKPERMIARIETMVDASRAASTRLTLVEAQLGRIHVNVWEDGEGTSITLASDSQALRARMEDSSDTLRAHAVDRGLRLASVDVTLTTGNSRPTADAAGNGALGNGGLGNGGWGNGGQGQMGQRTASHRDPAQRHDPADQPATRRGRFA